jgi:hypothetical protein
VVDFYAGATDPEAEAPASVLSGPRTFFHQRSLDIFISQTKVLSKKNYVSSECLA